MTRPRLTPSDQKAANAKAPHWFPDAIAEAERLTYAAAGSVLSSARNQATMDAKAIVVVMARAARVSYPTIGRLLGRDHTTVMALYRRAADDPTIRRHAHTVARAIAVYRGVA